MCVCVYVRVYISLYQICVSGYNSHGAECRTLHSYFGVGTGEGTKEALLEGVVKNKPALERIRHAGVIVMEEISMTDGSVSVHGVYY